MLKLTKILLLLAILIPSIFWVVQVSAKKPQAQNSDAQYQTIAAQNQTIAAQAPAPAAKHAEPDKASAAKTAPAAHPELLPVTIRIPGIALSAPIVKTGLEANGALHVPSSPDLTGWYELGPKPGEVGPAVITGHLDSASGPGVFFNLHKTKPGDEVDIVRDDGSIAVFKIDKLESYPQNNFATQKVYGAIATAGLRIITCSGVYSKTSGHYSDDLVVYATLQKISEPGAYQPL